MRHSSLRPAALMVLLLLSLPARAQGWEWAQRAGSIEGGAAPGDVGRRVAVDAAGNAYVTGYFFGTAGFGPFTLTSAGENDVFLVKYSPDGDVLWAWQGGGSGEDFGGRVRVDAEDNVYLAGYFNGTATFGDTTLTSAGFQDVFLAKFTTAGGLLWVRTGGGDARDVCYDVATDADGNVYITGRFGYPIGAPATFGSFTLTSAGTADFYLVKYSPEGDVLWALSGGGADGDRGYGIAVDAAGDVYAAGRFEGTSTFGDTTLTSAGSNDGFLVKYSPEGAFRWAQRIGGTDNDAIRELAADGSGAVYAAGHFAGTATFGDTTLTSVDIGGTPETRGDCFLVRFAPDGGVDWARSAGGRGSDACFGLAVDTDGHPYVTGHFSDRAAFGPFVLTSAGSNDAFVARYTPDGDVRWALGGGGSLLDRAHGVAVDADGNAYVVGFFRGTATFGPFSFTSAGGNDIFVAKAYARAPVAVTVTPLNPPIVIPPGGGSLRFTATLTNTSSQPQTVDAWTAATGPISREPLFGPRTLTLPAGATVTRTLEQWVPGITPAGTYTYYVRLGTFPSAAASASFPFEKVAGDLAGAWASGAGEGWDVSGWGDLTEAAAEVSIPGGLALSEARPNPFTRQAHLALEVAEAQHVTAEVLDALGRRVAVLLDGPVAAGAQALVVEAGALPAGLYVVRVAGEHFSVTRRLVLLR